MDSRFRGNDAHGAIFRRAWALRPFYLTAWVFLPDPAAAGHCICAPVYPVTISLATKSVKHSSMSAVWELSDTIGRAQSFSDQAS